MSRIGDLRRRAAHDPRAPIKRPPTGALYTVGQRVLCKHGWTTVDRYIGSMGFLACGRGCLTVDVIEALRADEDD